MGGYMVCDKCRKSYKLQPGELPADHRDKCECGGNFKFEMYMNNSEEDKTSPIKYVLNKYVVVTDEDKELYEEFDTRRVRYDFKDNFEWYHILFLILVLLTITASIIPIILQH